MKKKVPTKKKASKRGKSKSKKNSKSKPILMAVDKSTLMAMDRSMEKSWGKIVDMVNQRGQPTVFKNPIHLAQKADDYFLWVDRNPEKRAELVKYEGSAQQEEVDLKRPYSMTDFSHFCNVSHAYFRNFAATLRAKGESASAQDREYLAVIDMIKEKVESQQLSGSMTGHFNANIVSRLLGLIEKKDVTSGDQPLQAPQIVVQASGPSLANSEDKVIP